MVDQFGSLIKHPPGTERVVPHFTVADVRLTRQPHGRAVGPQRGIQTMLLEPIHRRGPRQVHGVAKTLLPHPNSVHDHYENPPVVHVYPFFVVP